MYGRRKMTAGYAGLRRRRTLSLGVCPIPELVQWALSPTFSISTVDYSLPICFRLLRQITLWSHCSGEVIARGSTLSASGDAAASRGLAPCRASFTDRQSPGPSAGLGLRQQRYCLAVEDSGIPLSQ